jgi:hypothetical protein
MTASWITVGVLAVLLVGLGAGLFLLLAMGKLHLDLGWGRSLHALGPIEVGIAAPRELVFEILSAPYLGRAPRDTGIEVLARGKDLVVAMHHTKVHFYTAQTVEAVEFTPPETVHFTHLTGPVPHAVEEFALQETDGVTNLRYSGEIGIDFSVLGRLAGRHWVRPQWERVVRDHLGDVKRQAEQRATGPRARSERKHRPR